MFSEFLSRLFIVDLREYRHESRIKVHKDTVVFIYVYFVQAPIAHECVIERIILVTITTMLSVFKEITNLI